MNVLRQYGCSVVLACAMALCTSLGRSQELGDTANRATLGDVNNVIDFRRARLFARGEAFEVCEYVLGFDFGLSGRPSLLDAWIGVRDLPYLGHVRVGQGDDDLATNAIGWFAWATDSYGDQFTDTGGQAVTARATWLPYWDDATNGASFVHLGAAYSFRTPPAGTFSFAAYPEARTGAPASNNTPTFVNTGNIAAAVNQTSGPNLFFDGAYLNVTYFLTGEHRTYNKAFGIIDRVFPHEDFFRVRTEDGSIFTGKGAWEIAARYSHIDLNDANIQGGALHNFTIGLNWYLNPFTRVKWELIQANLDRAPAGDSQAYIAGMRFDMDF